MTPRVILSFVGVVGLFLLAGCFKSSTTQGSSESSSKSSKSSSGSSSPADADSSAYATDVRDLTAAYASSGLDVRSFQRTLGSVAADYGITDWERDEGTHVAIGRGLTKAQVGGAQAEQLSSEISDTNERRMAWIRSGYQRDPGQ
jgi:hypothetical protein